MLKRNPFFAVALFMASIVSTTFVAEAIGSESTKMSTVVSTSEVTTIPTTTVVVIPPSSTTSIHVSRAELSDITTSSVNRWHGAIPHHYGAGTGCTRKQASIVARAMWAEGAYDSDVEWMLMVISRESTCDSSAYNGRGRDDSWGLCQLNAKAGFFKPGRLLAGYDYTKFASNFNLNAKACARLWAECGRGPWIRGDYSCSKPNKRDVVAVVPEVVVPAG